LHTDIFDSLFQKHKIEKVGNALKRSKMKSFCVNPRRRREKLGVKNDNYREFPPLFFVGSETRGGILYTNDTDGNFSKSKKRKNIFKKKTNKKLKNT